MSADIIKFICSTGKLVH